MLWGHVQGEGWMMTEGVGRASVPPKVLRKGLQYGENGVCSVLTC